MAVVNGGGNLQTTLGALNFPTTRDDGSPLQPGDLFQSGGIEYTYQPWGAWKANTGGAGGGGSIEVGPTPPDNPNDGDLWWNSLEDEGVLYVWYDNIGEWIQTVPTGATAAAGGGGGEDLIPDWDTAGWPTTHPGVPGYGASGVGSPITNLEAKLTNDKTWSSTLIAQDPCWRQSKNWKAGAHVEYTDSHSVGAQQPLLIQTPKNFKGKKLIVKALGTLGNTPSVDFQVRGTKVTVNGVVTPDPNVSDMYDIASSELPDGYIVTMKPNNGNTIYAFFYEFI